MRFLIVEYDDEEVCPYCNTKAEVGSVDITGKDGKVFRYSCSEHVNWD